MIGLMSGILGSGKNVFPFEVRIFLQDLVVRRAFAQKGKNIADSNSQASDAGSAATLAGFNRNSFQSLVSH